MCYGNGAQYIKRQASPKITRYLEMPNHSPFSEVLNSKFATASVIRGAVPGIAAEAGLTIGGEELIELFEK